MRLPAFRRLALGSVLALTLTTGCGGGSEPSADPAPTESALGPVELVRASADATQDAGSARIELTSEVVVGEQTVSFTGSGAFDAAARRGTFSLDVPVAGGVIEQRIVDETVYLTLPQEPGVFYSIPLADLAGTSLGGSTDPTAALQALRGVADDVEEVGTEVVRDVETTHYTGYLDVAAAIEQAQGLPKAVLQSTLGRLGVERVPFDVHLDEEGRVRRYAQVLQVPAGEQTGGQALTSRSSVDVFDFGSPVEVEAPPSEQVKDGTPLLQLLQGALPGAGASS